MPSFGPSSRRKEIHAKDPALIHVSPVLRKTLAHLFVRTLTVILHPQSGWPHEAPQRGLLSERLFHWLCSTHCPSAEHRRTGPIRRANCLIRRRRGVFARPVRSRSAGQSEGPRDRVPFLLVRFLWASKENEQSIILSGSVEPLQVPH